MNVTIPLPDDFAARFGSEAQLGRRVLEALALDEYRANRLTKPELQEILGFRTWARLDGFLKEHGVIEAMTMSEFERDLQDMERAGL